MLAFAAGSYVITVLTAGLILFRWERAESQIAVFAWQALVYGIWLPVAAIVWRIFKRHGLGERSVRIFILLGVIAVPAHAVFMTFIDIKVGSADLIALVLARFQVDTLTYSAFGIVAMAAALRRRADEEALAAAEIAQALAAASSALKVEAPDTEPPRLLVSTGTKRVLVPLEEVEWFGSAGNYVVVNWGEREGLLRRTLKSLDRELDPLVFARSHRGTIVNLRMVRAAETLSDGSWKLSLQSGSDVVVSRKYRDDILNRLK
jgi:DNA-binding LytR/AlgR family response regulator